MTHSFYNTTELITAIDSATNIDEALAITGRIKPQGGIIPSAHSARMDYIIAKRGARAVGGFFNPTKAKVTQKFIAVWNDENTEKTVA